PPYIFRAANGSLKGILVDQWALWEKHTGIQVRIEAMAWAKAQQRMQAGEGDVIDTMFASEQRKSVYDFSSPYAQIDVPIFFSKDLSGIRGPNDLSGFIVGAKRGDNSVAILKANGVSNIILYDSYEGIIGAARDGRIKVFTVDKPPALYYLIQMGIQDLFRESAPLYHGELHRAVRKGDTALLDAVERGFKAISRFEYQTIDRRWFGAPLLTRRDLTIAAAIATASAGLLALLLLWVWMLRRIVRQRTEALRRLNRELRAVSICNQTLMRTEDEPTLLREICRIVCQEAGYHMAWVGFAEHDAARTVRPVAWVGAEDGSINLAGPTWADSDPAPASEIIRTGASVCVQDFTDKSQARPWQDRARNLGSRSFLGLPLKAGDATTFGVLCIYSREADAFPPGEIRLLEELAGDLAFGIMVLRGREKHKLIEQQQRHLQAQLQQAQKMESLGSLAGGVAHDMNNVLGAILGLASASIETQPPGSRIHRALGTIIQAAERGGKMVQSLLSFARQSPAEVRELDLNALLRDDVHLLERTTLSKVDLELDLAPGLRPVSGDPSALANAFMNLCVNAVDAMEGGGTLTLRSRNLEDGSVEIQVQDDGCGMPREVLDKALDPFFTTKKPGKGTGLGLSMVYSAVKAHHGQMELLSEPGRGTCVRMLFPAAAPAPPATPEPAPEPAPGHRGLAILLVDDDDLVQSSTEALLEIMGHRARVAGSGEAALQELQSGYRPDLVILDMNMPGLGGAGTLPRIRALLPGVPVLLATGRADQAAMDLLDAYPGVTLLSKPFSMAELQKHLEPVGRS
ncbi:MAG: transporter substrate-binding domain-containing protein, partial [Holophaga sp.]|nr:transporter substrate-binding domain-containing protein [Holophaga sp.]